MRERQNARPDPHLFAKGGLRVYLSSSSKVRPSGIYHYTLTYRANYQLSFTSDHDELHWNVNGNAWNFPIDKAGVTIHLPRQVPVGSITHNAYTGAIGAKGKDCESKVGADGTVHFNTTAPLAQNTALTIIVGWQKGFVTRPTNDERMHRLLRDNSNIFIGLAGVVMLLLYYGIVWIVLGRDPEKGVIIPRYEPPDGISPASARFIRSMRYDAKTLASALINLAVKGLVEITQANIDRINVRYTINRQHKHDSYPSLAAGELVLMDKLFEKGDKVEVSRHEYARVTGAMKKHKSALKRDFEKTYFYANAIWIVPGILITIGMMLMSVRYAPVSVDGLRPLFMLFVFLFLFLIVAGVLSILIGAVRDGGVFQKIAMIVVAVYFSIYFAFPAFKQVYSQEYLDMALLLTLAFGSNVLFYHLFKAPTLAGRRVLDKLEGFRLYLEMTEKDDINKRYPTWRTPQHFDANLPYTLALDVESKWAERFANAFVNLGEIHPK